MINKKKAIEQVEQMDSFGPIMYRAQGRTLVFAKRNNRLFRIAFDWQSPMFFAVYPDKIERMTWAELNGIIRNYNGGNPNMQKVLSKLSRQFQLFSKNMAGEELKFIPSLYQNSCSMIVASEDFKKVVKQQLQSVPFMAPTTPIATPKLAVTPPPPPLSIVPVKKKEIQQAKEEQPEEPVVQIEKTVEAKPHSVLQMDAIAVTDTDLTLPVDKAFSVDENLIKFYGVSDQRPHFESFYDACKMKRALQLGIKDLRDPRCQDFEFAPRWFNNQEVVFKKGSECVHISVDKRGGYIQNIETGETVKLNGVQVLALLKKMDFRMPYGSGQAKVDDFPTVEQALETDYLRRFFLIAGLNKDTASIPCHGSVILKRYGLQYLKLVQGEKPVFETYDRNGVVVPMNKSQFEALLQTLFDVSKEGKQEIRCQFEQVQVEATPVVKEPVDSGVKETIAVEDASVPEIQIVPESEKTIEETLADMVFFYGPHMTRPNFEFEQKLQKMRHAYQKQNPNFEAPVINPLIDCENVLHYEKDGVVYAVSLDLNNPAFFKHRQGRQIGLMKRAELNEVFETLIPNKVRAKSYFQQFAEIRKCGPAGRGHKTSLPSIGQIFEIAKYHALLAGETRLPNIGATLCSDNIVVAKYGDVLYKVGLEEWSWGAYENGVMRPMTPKECAYIKTDLKKNYTQAFLRGRGIVLNKQPIESRMSPIDYFNRAANRLKSNVDLFVDTFETGMTEVPVADIQEISVKTPMVSTSILKYASENVPEKQPIQANALADFIGTNVCDDTLPSFRQLLTGLKKTVDIPATHCADNCIYARKNGVYHKINLSAPITFESMENNVVRSMRKDELTQILSDLGDMYESQHVTLLNVMILNAVFDAAVQQTPVQKEIFQQQIVEQSEPVWEQKKPVVEKPIQTITPEQACTPNELTIKTDRLRQLLFSNCVVDSLVPTDYPVSAKTKCPDEIVAMPKNDIFFWKPALAPHLETFYYTQLAQAQAAQRETAFYTEDQFGPMLFAGDWVCEKWKDSVSCVSLNRSNPCFLKYNMVRNTVEYLSMPEVNSLLTRWLKDAEKARPIVDALKPLYKKFVKQGVIPKNNGVYPSFEEVYNLRASERVRDQDKTPFHIAPTVCAGNMIVGKLGGIYYRIKVDEKVKFERLSEGEIYLMTPTEFYHFMKAAEENDCFPKEQAHEIVSLLRDIYKKQQKPLFDYSQCEQITRAEGKKMLNQKTEAMRFSVQREKGTRGR